LICIIFPVLSFDEIDHSRDLAFGMLALGVNYTTYPLMIDAYRFHGEKIWNADSEQYMTGYRKLLKIVVPDPDGGGKLHSSMWVNNAPTTTAAAEACLSKTLTFNGCPPEIEQLRCSGLRIVPDGAKPWSPHQAYWDVTDIMRRGAWYNIVLTVLLTIVILVMYILLSIDVSVMVVQPIESMVNIVRRLAEDPALQLEGQSKSKFETE